MTEDYWMRAEDGNCPRCGGGIPTDENRGEFPGALSRVAAVEICSMCGEDEALAHFLTEGLISGLIPVSEWPVDRESMKRRMLRIHLRIHSST